MNCFTCYFLLQKYIPSFFSQTIVLIKVTVKIKQIIKCKLIINAKFVETEFTTSVREINFVDKGGKINK
jgi:hypothetical protein